MPPTNGWKGRVEDLENRISRCSRLLTEEFQPRSVDMSGRGGHLVEKVVSDKNTIVQITVHTKAKDKTAGAAERKPEPRLPEKKTAARKKSDSRSPRRRGGRQKETTKPEPEGEEEKKEKSVTLLLQELREIIKTSGVKDVYDFLHELEDGRDRRKSAPEPGRCSAPHPSVKSLSEKLLEEKERREKEQQEGNLRAEEVKKLKGELTRYRKEYETTLAQLKISKDTNQNLNSQTVELKQLISKLTGNNRNLVQLVTDRASHEERLVEVENKNAQLMQQLEKDRATLACYEAKFREQEEEIVLLKSLAVDIKAQLHHGLEGLEMPRPGSSLPPHLMNKTRDILGQTLIQQHRRPASQSSDSAFEDPASESRSVSRPVFHPPPPPTSDSQPVSTVSAVQPQKYVPSYTGTPSTQPPPSSNNSLHTNRPGTEGAARQNTGSTTGGRGAPQPPDRAAPRPPDRGAPRPPDKAAPRPPDWAATSMSGRGVPPPFYSNSPPTRQVSAAGRVQAGEPATAPQQNFLPNLPKSKSDPPPLTSTGPRDLHQSSVLSDLPVYSRQTARNLFSAASRYKSSTLITSLQQDETRSNQFQVPAVRQPGTSGPVQPEVFNPVQLDLEETVSPDELDDDVSGGKSKSTPATVVERVNPLAGSRGNHSTIDGGVTRGNQSTTDGGLTRGFHPDRGSEAESSEGSEGRRKVSLENKVQAFLDRLHQESLNFSLPQARSFQGPSFHLSVSGEEDLLGNLSTETTLTEGRFRKGLETSIEIIPQEFSHT